MTLELLEAGTEVNTRSNEGHTGLLIAAQNNHPETVHLLLENGAKVG